MRRTPRVVPSPVSSDAEAFARVARGDLGALGELYDRYAGDLFRFARRAAPDDDAEDVVHVVFERLLRSSVRHDTRRSAAGPWLFGVTARVLRERQRPARRFAMALVARIRASQTPSVAKVVQRAERSQLDDVSLRRLRHRILASADARLKGAPARHSSPFRLIAPIALASVFAGALVHWPRLEYAGSTAAKEKATIRIQRALPEDGDRIRSVLPGESERHFGDTSSPSARSEPVAKSSAIVPRPSESRPRKTPKSMTTVGASAARPSADDDKVEEDLAYLRIVALLAEGRQAEAVLAAQAYLGRFPEGFRRPEVRTVALGP
jgi:DNA-directed RNA polymerase specialized sigma24 family protein